MAPTENIKRYRFTEVTSVHHGVVVSQPGGQGPVTVYIPPREEQLPYERRFSTMAEAETFAASQLPSIDGVDTYVVTRETGDAWWLSHLTPIATP
jgi:hypothetical protein